MTDTLAERLTERAERALSVMGQAETGLIPIALDRPALVPADFSEKMLARALAWDDPDELWDGATSLGGAIAKWSQLGYETIELEVARAFLEVTLGQKLGENPGSGGDHRSKGFRSSPRADLIPKQRVEELRRFHGFLARLIALIRDERERRKRAPSRRRLLAAVDDWSRPPRPAHAGLTIDLRPGDFRDALSTVPDGSVDAIITDPPYPAEYLPLYEDLARVASRILVPGGSLLCMVGQSYLPDVLRLMTPCLTYHWTVAYLTPGAHLQVWGSEVMTGWKPVLWMTRGDYTGGWKYDVVRSDADDKTFHDWGQSESGMRGLVERFTAAGDLIVDPFLGGGTTALVAARLGRRFIGCDNDVAAFAVASRRLEDEVGS